MVVKESAAWRHIAAAAIGIIIGGVIWFAVSPARHQLKEVRVERDTLGNQVGALNQRIVLLQSELKTLQDRNSAHLSEVERLTVALTEKEQASARAEHELGDRKRAVATLEERNRVLALENAEVREELLRLRKRAETLTAERDALALKLGVAGRTLEEAQARATELNKSYEALLAEKASLADDVAARRAELQTTKQSLEDAQGEVARLMGARGIYTVQHGDSLSTIAAFFYRNSQRWPDIFKANASLLTNADLVFPNQVLIIPQ